MSSRGVPMRTPGDAAQQSHFGVDKPCWSQHGIAGVDDDYVPIARRSPLASRSTPKYNGFSLVPPPFEDCTRGHDGANIKRLHEASGFVLG